jgi:hypothetical protein
MSTFRLGAVVAGALVVAGCGATSPLADDVVEAMRDRVAAYKKHDAAGYCRKTFASTDLPVALALRLRVRTGVRDSGASWEKADRECARDFGDHGEFDSPIRDFSMNVTVDPPMKAIAGIDRTATAEVRVKGGGRPLRVVFVRYRDDWKVVFEAD